MHDIKQNLGQFFVKRSFNIVSPGITVGIPNVMLEVQFENYFFSITYPSSDVNTKMSLFSKPIPPFI